MRGFFFYGSIGAMISRKDIEGLAELSRLKLGEEELAGLEKDFSAILEYVGQISALTSGEVSAEVPAVRNVLREDTARAGDDLLAGAQEKILAAAPRREGDYLLVRKILERDEPTL